MARTLIRWVVTFSLCLLIGLAGPAQAEKKKKKPNETSLAGLIYTTATSNRPTVTGYDAVEGVEILLDGTEFKTTTDVRGMFEFKDLPDGDYTIVARRTGFGTVTKAVKVESGPFPATVQLVMNPTGTAMVGDTPTGPGTVYVAFAARQASQAGRGDGGGNFPLATQQIFRSAVANGADPFSIAGNAPQEMRGPQNDWNPTTTDPNNLMMYPPGSPNRTGFQSLQVTPYWICFNKAGNTMYLSNQAQQIQVYDAAHGNTLLRNLPAQGFVTDLRPSPDGRYVLAAVMSTSPFVMLIDAKTHDPIGQLMCPNLSTGESGQPRAVAMSPDGSRVYVVMGTPQSGEVCVIDALSGQALGSVPVGPNPTGAALAPDGRFLFVVNSGSANVSVLDAFTMAEVGRVTVGINPQKVAISPDGTRVFVTNKQSGTVSVLDGRALGVVATSKVGDGPMSVAISPDGSRAFVTCKDSGTVVMLDGKTGSVLHTTVPLPNSSPYGLAVKP